MLKSDVWPLEVDDCPVWYACFWMGQFGLWDWQKGYHAVWHCSTPLLKKSTHLDWNPQFTDPRCLDLTLSWNLTLAVSTLFQLPKEQCWTESRPRLPEQNSGRLGDHWRFRAPLWSSKWWQHTSWMLAVPTGSHTNAHRKEPFFDGTVQNKLLISSFMSNAEADCILTCDPSQNLQVGGGHITGTLTAGRLLLLTYQIWAFPGGDSMLLICVLSLLGELQLYYYGLKGLLRLLTFPSVHTPCKAEWLLWCSCLWKRTDLF